MSKIGQDRHPWQQGTIRLRTSSLRDCALRAIWNPERSAKSCAGLLGTVSEWRDGIGCTSEQWDELVALLKIPPTPTPIRRRSR